MSNSHTLACDVLRELKALTGRDGVAEHMPDTRDGAFITLDGTGYRIRIVAQAGRGEARGYVPSFEGCEAYGLAYRLRPALGATSFDMAATPARIAKQIVRRIVDPAKPLIAKMREYIAAQNASRTALADQERVWRDKYPRARIAAKDGAVSIDITAKIAGEYRYIDFEIREDGSANIRRSSAVPGEAMEAMLAAMFAGAAL